MIYGSFISYSESLFPQKTQKGTFYLRNYPLLSTLQQQALIVSLHFCLHISIAVIYNFNSIFTTFSPFVPHFYNAFCNFLLLLSPFFATPHPVKLPFAVKMPPDFYFPTFFLIFATFLPVFASIFDHFCHC